MHHLAKGAAPSRRTLLAAAGLGVVGFAAGAATVAKAALPGTAPGGTARPFSLQHGGLAEWSSVVGDSFAVLGGATVLKLVAVRALPAEGRRPASLRRSDAFAAHFETRAELAEGTYRVAHRLLGPLDLHLAPGKRNRLLAVFN